MASARPTRAAAHASAPRPLRPARPRGLARSRPFAGRPAWACASARRTARCPATRGRLRAAEVDAPRVPRADAAPSRAAARAGRARHLPARGRGRDVPRPDPARRRRADGPARAAAHSRARGPTMRWSWTRRPPATRCVLLDAPAQLRQLARITRRPAGRRTARSSPALARGYEPDDADRSSSRTWRPSRRAEGPAGRERVHLGHPPRGAGLGGDALDGLAALRARGFDRLELLVNRVTRPPTTPCAWCAARVRAEKTVLAAIRKQPIPVAWLPEQPVEVRGGTRCSACGRDGACRRSGRRSVRARGLPRPGRRRPCGRRCPRGVGW